MVRSGESDFAEGLSKVESIVKESFIERKRLRDSAEVRPDIECPLDVIRRKRRLQGACEIGQRYRKRCHVGVARMTDALCAIPAQYSSIEIPGEGWRVEERNY